MLCFDNLTLPPPLLRPALPTPSKYRAPDPTEKRRRRALETVNETHRAESPSVREAEDNEGLFAVGVQWRQCHHGHVMPNRRCTDANPWLPQGLFGTETEGMADRSQPGGEAYPLCTFN